MSNLISARELYEARESLHVIDASWYLPNQQRDAKQEYLQQHIEGAHFFDIDLICDLESPLPHMLPSSGVFAQEISRMGISNQDAVVVYDSAGLFSAARLWWMFRVFGHSKVRVLNGGLPAWTQLELPTSSSKPEAQESNYNAVLNSQLIATREGLIANCENGAITVLDARPLARFEGQAPEPRPGLPSGHMPHSVSLSFDLLLDQGQLKSTAELEHIFAELGVSKSSNVVTSCGSGVTAAIISLALDEVGYGLKPLYDGAWAEWGTLPAHYILTDD